MHIISKLLVCFIAAEHIYILWLEMFAWTTRARKVFKGFSAEYFEKTKTLAGNQGLYNGFLSAGLLWSVFIMDPLWAVNIAMFFCGCVMIAGIYGALSAQRSIFFVQGLPAILALLALVLKI